MEQESKIDKLLANKKVLIICCVVVFAIMIILVIQSAPKRATNNNTTMTLDEIMEANEFTDSSQAEEEGDIIESLIAQNRITEALPIKNDEPYYVIDFTITTEGEEWLFAIEIVYKDEEGKKLALERLSQPDLAEYDIGICPIVYTNLSEKENL